MKKACVIGWPVQHSRSPLIHNYWLRKYKISSTYERRPLELQEVSNFIASLANSEFIGCNVTLPYKETVYLAVSKADDIAKRLGAANTVYLKDGVVWGTNTDGEGFIAALQQSYPALQLRGKSASIIGAGGAAKAIVGALLDEGVESVGVINRTPERIHSLQRQFGPRIFEIKEHATQAELAARELLINTTSLGMDGQPSLELDISSLNSKALVADIIYAPLETALIRKAKALGNPTLGGLGMLLHQAVRGFELWFGVRPEVTSGLYKLVADDIRGISKK